MSLGYDESTYEALRHIGGMIRDRRCSLDWSQRDLERASGVNQATISRVERGLMPGLRMWRVARLLAALDRGDAWPNRHRRY